MPLNRFIAFVKPYLNLIAAAAAAWLVAKANVLGIPGLGDRQNELATGLAAAGVWVLTQAAAQLGDLKWLKGHHIALSKAAASSPIFTTAGGGGVSGNWQCLPAPAAKPPAADEEPPA